MVLLRCSYALIVFLVFFAGCTGESVRVVLPDRHPADPSAAEAPFVPIPDPFAGVSLPAAPSSPAKPFEQRHEHHPGQTNEMQMEDMQMEDMQMEDMQMEDDKGSDMKHGGHGGSGAGRGEERR